MCIDRLLLGFSLTEPIPEKNLEGLRKYKYASVDNSLLSKYVLCHYWNWLVQFVPLWMAYTIGMIPSNRVDPTW